MYIKVQIIKLEELIFIKEITWYCQLLLIIAVIDDFYDMSEGFSSCLSLIIFFKQLYLPDYSVSTPNVQTEYSLKKLKFLD